MNPRLRVEVGRQANYEYEVPPLDEGEPVWLGRGAFCQVRISDTQLSRRHAQFSYDNGRLYVEDLGSHNGTFVNDRRVEGKIELHDGDSITVGNSRLRVVFPTVHPQRGPSLAELGTRDDEREAADKARALAGTEFAGYSLGQIVFDGQTSVVFRARESSSSQEVAVKVLKPLRSISIEDQNRFIRGAKHSSALKHPNFVQVLKGGRVGDWFFVAMEYVRGTSLQQMVESRGSPLDLAPAVKILRQVLQALQYAYEQDIVFRAVRPDNIIVGDGLTVKMTDFDLVKPLTGRAEAQVTRVMDGTIQVEPQFAAPELIAYPVVADQKSDVFGAGAALYYMLCARAPFGEFLPADKLSSAFDRTFDSPRAINPSVPQAVCDVMTRAMSDYERYSTPGEMLQALDHALGAAAD
jgi:pSer/pThr/pTyr-binding forkhead associated (FHA) protein